MEWMTSNSFLMMQKSMGFLWTKQTTILNNLSNVETPGYKEKYVTFEETLRSRLQSASHHSTPIASYRSIVSDSHAVVRESSTESARLDGNSVNATEQGVELTRNTFQLQHVMNAITSDLTTLRTAIRGQ